MQEISELLFKYKESGGKGEAKMIQPRMHPSQQKFLDLLSK
jgi:hypothetical protein